MTQQEYQGNENLRMNEYTFELLKRLKKRVCLYAVKTPYFIHVYNLKKELRFVHIFTLYGRRPRGQHPQINHTGSDFAATRDFKDWKGLL